MGRHSKHNTASGHFTYAEYHMLKDQWGTKALRLGHESFRSFDSCSLCLSSAISPVLCDDDHGHLFCRECVLTNLVEQKMEIERVKQQLERLQVEEEEKEVQQKQMIRERVIREFEARNTITSSSSSSSSSTMMTTTTVEGKGIKRKNPEPEEQDTKLFQDRMEQATQQVEKQALNQIRKERTIARKAKLPSFWLPSLTPSQIENTKPKLLAQSLKPLCKIDDENGHKIGMKTLVTVEFVQNEDGKKICTGCSKPFSNSLLLSALKQCGHVYCSICIDNLIQKVQHPSCIRCETSVKLEPKHQQQKDSKTSFHTIKKGQIIQLNREGTGFAAGGISHVQKKGVAFQG